MTARVALAQVHSIAGDLNGNTERMLQILTGVTDADIVLFPEMAVSGYQIDDLAGSVSFLNECREALDSFLAKVPVNLVVAVGCPLLSTDYHSLGGVSFPNGSGLDSEKRKVYNCLVLAQAGKILAVHAKALLPTYGVFDDARWMAAGPTRQFPIEVAGSKVALAVCEDVWTDEVPLAASSAGADLLLVANASPFTVGKPEGREAMLTRLASLTGMCIAYTNMVGGQDEVVYDGGSLLVDARGVKARAPLFAEQLTVSGMVSSWPSELEQVWSALVCALRDYVHDNSFKRVVIGLSGGLDSAVVAAVAVDALGADSVWGVGMPGPYSSPGSVYDAVDLAERLGVRFDIIGIDKTFEAELSLIDDLIEGGAPVAIENIQARLRALHIMTLANAHNMLMLNTGNKSEAAVGYFTLGGDSSGGFALLKDVYKTTVFALARWRNEHAELLGQVPPIPAATISKPPSAELAPDQQDTDSLPPYPVLDRMLALYLERQLSALEITELVSDLAAEHGYALSGKGVAGILRKVDLSEHKRRQVAPGVKITSRAFGKDRRMPITNRRVHLVE